MITVLLIEDDTYIRENTTEALELEGYRVIAAHNGRVGINLGKAEIPDIVLCDLLMPEADGWEVFRQLRNNKSTSHIPFIFLTASVDLATVEKVIGSGAEDYILKPFDPAALFDSIVNSLQSR